METFLKEHINIFMNLRFYLPSKIQCLKIFVNTKNKYRMKMKSISTRCAFLIIPKKRRAFTVKIWVTHLNSALSCVKCLLIKNWHYQIMYVLLKSVVCAQLWSWEELTQQDAHFCQKKISSKLLFWSDLRLFMNEPTKLRHMFRKLKRFKNKIIWTLL